MNDQVDIEFWHLHRSRPFDDWEILPESVARSASNLCLVALVNLVDKPMCPSNQGRTLSAALARRLVGGRQSGAFLQTRFKLRLTFNVSLTGYSVPCADICISALKPPRNYTKHE